MVSETVYFQSSNQSLIFCREVVCLFFKQNASLFSIAGQVRIIISRVVKAEENAISRASVIATPSMTSKAQREGHQMIQFAGVQCWRLGVISKEYINKSLSVMVPRKTQTDTQDPSVAVTIMYGPHLSFSSMVNMNCPHSIITDISFPCGHRHNVSPN